VEHGKIELPLNLKNKKAVVNVANIDEKCFMYAVLSVLHYDPTKHNERVTYYMDKLDSINVENIKFPFTISQLKTFNRNNPHIGVNILQWNEKKGCAKVLVNAPLDDDRRIINVLLVEHNGFSHFLVYQN